MQNDEIKANDEFILHSSDGKDYKIIIYNVNHFRPPEFAIAFLLYNKDGKLIPSSDSDDFWFVGEGFFILNKNKLEKVKVMNSEKMKKKKVKFNIPLEYVAGHLRYGHMEGTLDLTEEEFKKLEENPLKFVDDNDILDNLELIIDDYRIDDWGGFTEVDYKVVE